VNNNNIIVYIHTVKCLTVPQKKQFTVAVIKPDAVKAGMVDEIIEKVTAQVYLYITQGLLIV